MTQSRRNKIHSIDARIYLLDNDHYPSLLNELTFILEEEEASYNVMPEGLRDSDRGKESSDAQECLRRALKALGKIVDGKKRTQDLMDTIHENLRAV